MSRYIAIFENGNGYLQGTVIDGANWIDAAERWESHSTRRLVALSMGIGSLRTGKTIQFYVPEYEYVSKVVGSDDWTA